MTFSNMRFRLGSQIFLLIYLSIGLLGLLTPRQEIFPFFSWFLFPETPQIPQREYNLRLFEVNGVHHGVEPYYKDAPSAEYAEQPNSPEVWQIIQNMGKAYLAEDTERLNELRHLLETAWIPNVTGYSLVMIDYDPIKRFNRDPSAFAEITLERFSRLNPKGNP
jgi:hypothetical protein